MVNFWLMKLVLNYILIFASTIFLPFCYILRAFLICETRMLFISYFHVLLQKYHLFPLLFIVFKYLNGKTIKTIPSRYFIKIFHPYII